MSDKRNCITDLGGIVRFLLLIFAGVVLFFGPAVSDENFNRQFSPESWSGGRTVDHSAFGALLARYVVPSPDGINRVRYRAWKGEGHRQLKAYLAALIKQDPGSLTRDEQFAYWVNLYNAKTLDIVLDAYPVKSVRDISLGGGLLDLLTVGPWKSKVIAVNGVRLSLDNIEHDILRPLFLDSRVHYAVNCASIGCPNLRFKPFRGETLDADLNEAARAFINHPRAVQVIGRAVELSSIYKWYGGDFGSSERALLRHIKMHASSDLAKKLEGDVMISGYDYDWSLNDAR